MAQPTYRDMIQRVRAALLDTNAPVRWSDAFIMGAIVDALRLLHSIRPESRYVGLELQKEDYPSVTEDMEPSSLESLLGMECHVDPRWLDAIRYHAEARCLEIDSADTANMQRVEYLYSQFNSLAKL